ncbi:hypothetical protein [Thermococcus sp. MV5]|uniref:hypothetical protein n=1 Tax=Thermococcus sp. MV5 TaxID=1638272 RepID=UPI001F0CEADB|nr:hypothetical protein [Thermococcus sp. MV5]
MQEETVSRDILKVAKVYEKFGIKFHNISKDGEVLISGFKNQTLFNEVHSSGLFVSGFGDLKLSNHADFWELIRIIETVKPEKIYTRYGYAGEFARILRGLEYDAKPLEDVLFSGELI